MKSLSEKISEKLIYKKYAAKVITINWKTFRFESKSLRKTLYIPIFSGDDIFNYAKSLFDEHNAGIVPLRLVGVGVAGLIEVDEKYYNKQQY